MRGRVRRSQASTAVTPPVGPGLTAGDRASQPQHQGRKRRARGRALWVGVAAACLASWLTAGVLWWVSSPTVFGGPVPLMDALYPDGLHTTHEVVLRFTGAAPCDEAGPWGAASAVHVWGARAGRDMHGVHLPMTMRIEIERQSYLAVGAYGSGCTPACTGWIDGEQMRSCSGFIGSSEARRFWERIEGPLEAGLYLSMLAFACSHFALAGMILVSLGRSFSALPATSGRSSLPAPPAGDA